MQPEIQSKVMALLYKYFCAYDESQLYMTSTTLEEFPEF